MGLMVITKKPEFSHVDQGRLISRILSKSRIALCVCCITFSYTCAAAGWRWEPGIALGEIYTDNVTLANDTEKESEFIAYIVPGIKANRQARQFSFDLDYTAQALFYYEVPDRNQVFHQFSSNLASELLDNWFFFDGLLSYTQAIIDPEETVAFDNISVTSNRTDVATGSVHPYIRHSFNDDYLMVLGTTSSVVDYRDQAEDGSEIPDIDSNEDEFSLEKLPGQSDWRWKLSYSSELEEEGDAVVLDYSVSELALYYALTGKIELFATSGEERDLFTNLDTQDNPRKSFWIAGFTFDSRHSRLEMAVGDRAYGRARRFRWDRASRILNMALSYNERIESFARQRSQIIPAGTSVPVLDREIAPEWNGLDSVRPDIFLEKSSRADFVLDISKSFWNLSYYKIDRDFFRINDEETEESVGLTWIWDSTPVSRFRFGAQRIRYIRLGDDNYDYFNSVNAGYEKSVGRRARIVTEYLRRNRDTGDDLSDYEENRVSIGIGYIF
jgi:hypothetical protein